MLESWQESQVTISFILIFIGWGLKIGITKLIKLKSLKKGIDKRYLVNSTRNIINLCLIILLFVIWSEDLQRFALSIAAFVVAIVLATKEVIQCFIGFLYLSSTNPFRVGDWIQVGDYTGEVTSTDWAKVSILEVNASDYEYTGKTVFIPNSQLMTQPVKNLNFMRRYVNHNFSFTRDCGSFSPFKMKNRLLKQAKRYCSEFVDVAQRYNALIENRLEIQISGPAPVIKISTTDLGKVRVSFSLFCPTKQAKQIEQKLMRDFFEAWENEETRAKQPQTEGDDGQSNISG